MSLENSRGETNPPPSTPCDSPKLLTRLHSNGLQFDQILLRINPEVILRTFVLSRDTFPDSFGQKRPEFLVKALDVWILEYWGA
jgi:hypothetical protein